MCKQNDWMFSPETVTKIAESFAIVTFGSAFMHGSKTSLGTNQDVRSNDLFPFVIHQAAMSSIPYSPIIHDLADRPRIMSGEEMVTYWLDMFNTIPVSDWREAMNMLDVPPLQTTFAGIFGNIILLVSDLNTTVTVTTQLMDMFGLTPQEKEFFLSSYLPALSSAMESVTLSVIEKAELLENTAGTVVKLLYAFLWQEAVFDLGGANLTPEANAFGAALLPHVNNLGNNLTSWSLHVSDIQGGGGYPGSWWCNDIIPHAKWHVETAAALADVARLGDMVHRILMQ